MKTICLEEVLANSGEKELHRVRIGKRRHQLAVCIMLVLFAVFQSQCSFGSAGTK